MAFFFDNNFLQLFYFLLSTKVLDFTVNLLSTLTILFLLFAGVHIPTNPIIQIIVAQN
jgi:hypothetical protein